MGYTDKVDTRKTYDPTSTDAWRKLTDLSKTVYEKGILEHFTDNPLRTTQYGISLNGLHVDYSKHLVSDEILDALNSLAEKSPLAELRDAIFSGTPINESEGRRVLHTALRNPDFPDGAIASSIATQFNRMTTIANRIRVGDWKGYDGKRIHSVVNIGIGGSDLGPKMVCEALREFAQPDIDMHFISNVDGEPIRSLLKQLDPTTTIFVVASKTFTTQETMVNAQVAIDWVSEKTGITEPLSTPHFLAVTAATDTAIKLGIPANQVLQFWDWVGGRYSLWSVIGLTICICIGQENFRTLLHGAREMDDHFLNAPLGKNLPVQLALLGIWYNNFLDIQSTAVIPYCERLGFLPTFLQQLDMESNGKRVSSHGVPLTYDSTPVTWGQTGTNGQHAFFQLLHQGTRFVPIDFIGVANDQLSDGKQHRILLANMLAQAAALMSGEAADSPEQEYPGNRPSTMILLNKLTPHSLGMLLALYEHKVFCQGAIWNINSFDQWGVELGKRLTSKVFDDQDRSGLDPSTLDLIDRLGF